MIWFNPCVMHGQAHLTWRIRDHTNLSACLFFAARAV